MSCNQLDYKITHHSRLKIYKTHLPSVQMRQSPQPQLVLDSDQVREVGRLMFREGHHLCPSYRKVRKLLYILFEFISSLDPENLTTNINHTSVITLHGQYYKFLLPGKQKGDSHHG